MYKLPMLLLISALSIGCKNKDTEDATGPAVTTTADKVVIVRKTSSSNIEHDVFRAIVTFTNGHSNDIMLERVQFSGRMGGRPADESTKELGFSLESGSSVQVKLPTIITWKDNASMENQSATVSGTLYYTVNGKSRSVAFEARGPVVVKGE